MCDFLFCRTIKQQKMEKILSTNETNGTCGVPDETGKPQREGAQNNGELDELN